MNIQKELLDFLTFVVAPPLITKVYYRRKGGSSSLSSNYGVFVSLVHPWFIHASFWLQLTLTTLFLVCASWTFVYGFTLIPSQSSHPHFLLRVNEHTLDLHSITNLGINRFLYFQCHLKNQGMCQSFLSTMWNKVKHV
jgi:hypothetical protein